MARIRTIKPEFWTDETIVRLPHVARLLFIGLWNFADDTGALEYSPDRIRLQVLPAETDCDVGALLDLLVAAGLLEYWYDDDGTQAISISGWSKHQKIDNPSRKTVIREGYRKRAIPSEERLAVAKKYGCKPGGEAEASCYYCGMPGMVKWWPGPNGKPTRWVTLSDLEFDYFYSEHAGGETSSKNMVLACRSCNRAKREFDPHHFFTEKNSIGIASPIEPSPLERKGKDQEGKGGEGKGGAEPSGPAPDAAPPPPESLPVITIPLVDKSEHPVMRSDVVEWSEAYPAVDVMQELRAMRQWCIAHPTRRKTARGVRAFVVAWLGREQDRGGQRRPVGNRDAFAEFLGEPIDDGRTINA